LAGVLEGYSKLKQLGIPYNRPADYYAEMLKTDEHMQKVCTKEIAWVMFPLTLGT
jgi:rRNA-processing protein EBP2